MCRAITISTFAALFLDALTTAQLISAAAAEHTMVALPLDLPVVVMWYNPNAHADACSAVEVQFIDDQIASTLNLRLTNDGIESVEWASSLSLLNANKYDINNSLRNDREIIETECDTCLYDISLTNSLCNALHNCAESGGGRRHLRAAASTTNTAVDLDEVSFQLTSACHHQLETLSTNALLETTCQKALLDALCQTEFLL